MAHGERTYVTFSAIVCGALLQPDRIYCPTAIYSNLADRVFMFGSSYQKILPVKSNASVSPRTEREKGWRL